MTMLFMDSCSHYTAAQANRKWDAFNTTGLQVTGTNARHGSCLRFTTATTSLVGKSFTASGTVTVGFAFRPENTQSGNACILCFLTGSSAQVSITFNASGTIDVRLGQANTAVIGTTSAGCPINTWTYVEVKVLFSTTVGTIDILLNGVNRLALTGRNTGGTTANAVRFNDDASGRGWATWSMQDIYVLNSLGSHNNAALGDVYVEALYPSGPGANSGWAIGGTGPAATRWQSVNETTPDDNTTYISSSTPLDICDFTLTTTSLTPVSIAALQWCICVEKTNAGTSQVEAEVSISGTSYSPGTYNVTSNYVYGLIVSETNPTGTSPWVNADITGNYFGVELVF